MYEIIITKKAQRALHKLPSDIANLIIKKIKFLAEDPYAENNNVKRLKGHDAYRLRVGDYRVIYELEDNILVIQIVDIGHRKEVYS